jgi:hypothetical protein
MNEIKKIQLANLAGNIASGFVSGQDLGNAKIDFQDVARWSVMLSEEILKQIEEKYPTPLATQPKPFMPPNFAPKAPAA